MSWLNQAEVTTAAEKDRAKKDGLISQIEEQRKEQEDKGVTVDGVRYGGGPGNRQALREALEMAEDTGANSFPSWKSSDSQFLSDHPVANVRKALRAIGVQRSNLIRKEGQFIDQVERGKLTDISNLDWKT